jgi:hypothetical protein
MKIFKTIAFVLTASIALTPVMYAAEQTKQTPIKKIDAVIKKTANKTAEVLKRMSSGIANHKNLILPAVTLVALGAIV